MEKLATTLGWRFPGDGTMDLVHFKSVILFKHLTSIFEYIFTLTDKKCLHPMKQVLHMLCLCGYCINPEFVGLTVYLFIYYRSLWTTIQSIHGRCNFSIADWLFGYLFKVCSIFQWWLRKHLLVFILFSP